MLCDLASQSSIRRAAAEFKERFGHLHVLINNAAMYTDHYRITNDGIEIQFAVNYLGPFLLTNLLAETLVASAPARIINLSTANHFDVSLDLADLQSNANYEPKVVHMRSKLAVILFTYELARRLGTFDVTANTLHPGVIATNLLGQVRRVPVEKRTAEGMGDDVASLSVGARTPVYLATSLDVAGVTGCYFDNCELVESSPESRDPEKARILWELSARLTGLS
jgi:NAD(P)-dependent dehydrogenase (short-subunit alcohol dehydrogenase family)